MSTYNLDKVMSDYEHSRITVEMAIGHSLQHIDKLYEALAVVNASRTAEQTKLDTLEKRVNTLQMGVDRLTAIIEKFRVKRKPSDPKQPKPDQP